MFKFTKSGVDNNLGGYKDHLTIRPNKLSSAGDTRRPRRLIAIVCNCRYSEIWFKYPLIIELLNTTLVVIPFFSFHAFFSILFERGEETFALLFRDELQNSFQKMSANRSTWFYTPACLHCQLSVESTAGDATRHSHTQEVRPLEKKSDQASWPRSAFFSEQYFRRGW